VSDCAKAFKPTAASTAKTAVTRRRERAMGRAGSSIMGLTFLRPEPTGPVLRAQFSPLMQQKLIRIVKVLSACEAAAQPVGGRPGGRLCARYAVVDALPLRAGCARAVHREGMQARRRA
jgi:hypothetical protein